MLTVYLKPTNYCNVGCSHCYLPNSVRADKFKMDINRIEQSANFIRDMLSLRNENKVFIIWHGGEPLVLNSGYYEEVYNVYSDIIGKDKFRMGIQTSLIPFKHEHVEVVHKFFHSSVGTSVDFSQRKIGDSVERYLNLFLDKVSLARENDIEVIPGFVPTKNELGNAGDIVDWFIEHEFSMFNIDRYNDFGITVNDKPSNSEHAQFLIDIFDSIFDKKEKGLPVPLVNVVEAGIKGVLKGVSSERWGTTCQNDFVVIEPNGNLNSCPDRSTVEKPFSNISDGALAFASSEGRKRWIRESVIGHNKFWCGSCEFNAWCKSGCPITKNGANGECSGYKSYLLHIRNYSNKSKGNLQRLLSYISGDLC